MALYVATLCPTFSWGDSADLPLRIAHPADTYFADTPREYALYCWLGRLFMPLPFGDPAWRVNLMTALFGVLAVAVLYALVRLRTGSRLAAAGAAVALCVSHTFWLLSVEAEVYTLALLLQLLSLCALALWLQKKDPRALYAAALLAGLSLSHHFASLWLVLVLAVFLALRPKDLTWVQAAGAGALLLAGSSVAIELVCRIFTHYPAGEALDRLGGANRTYTANPLREAVLAVLYLCYQFPGPGLLLGGVGLGAVERQKSALDRLMLALWVTYTAWSVLDRIPDKFNAHVFAYPFFAYFIGLGIWRLRTARVRSLSLPGFHQPGQRAALLLSLAAAPVALYAAAPLASQALGIDLVRARAVPYRDNGWYFLFPPKRGYYGARRYARTALAGLPAGAVVVADYTLWRPLVYAQSVEGCRRDVELVSAGALKSVYSFVRARARGAPVYLASDSLREDYQLDLIEREWELEPAGQLFRLEPRR